MYPRTKLTTTLILLLGGSGSRFGNNTPKQLLKLPPKFLDRLADTNHNIIKDLPIFAITAFQFLKHLKVNHVIFVVNSSILSNQIFTDSISALENRFQITVKITEGGETRFDSFRNGCKELPSEGIALVQDANRPFVTKEMFSKIKITFTKIDQDTPCAIPVIPSTDSLCVIEDGGVSSYLKRETVYRLQTPQLIDVAVTKKLLAEPRSGFTDEGSFMLAAKQKVIYYEGAEENIKITYASDLEA